VNTNLTQSQPIGQHQSCKAWIEASFGKTSGNNVGNNQNQGEKSQNNTMITIAGNIEKISK